MTLQDPRTAKNIYAKGDWLERAKGIPTIPKMYENTTSFLDVNKLVSFDETLINQKDIDTEIIDFAKFFKER